jgi:hypothetical protein
MWQGVAFFSFDILQIPSACIAPTCSTLAMGLQGKD